MRLWTVKPGSGVQVHAATMRKLATALMGLTLLATPAAAEACRISIPIAERLDSWYEAGTIDTVIVGEVVETKLYDRFPAETSEWARRLRILETVRGEPLPDGEFVIEDVLISSCGWINNIRASEGDRGVFYLVRNAEGGLDSFLAFGLEEALREDPRLEGMQTQPRRSN